MQVNSRKVPFGFHCNLKFSGFITISLQLKFTIFFQSPKKLVQCSWEYEILSVSSKIENFHEKWFMHLEDINESLSKMKRCQKF